MLILFGIICFIIWFVFLKDTLESKNNTLIASVSLLMSALSLLFTYWVILFVGFMVRLYMLAKY